MTEISDDEYYKKYDRAPWPMSHRKQRNVIGLMFLCLILQGLAIIILGTAFIVRNF